MLRVVPEDDARQEFTLTLDEICRRGAERMLAVALEAEVDAYLDGTERLETPVAHGLLTTGRYRAAEDDTRRHRTTRGGRIRAKRQQP